MVLDLSRLGEGLLVEPVGERSLRERVEVQLLPYARRIRLAAQHRPRAGESHSDLLRVALESDAEVLFCAPHEPGLGTFAALPDPAHGEVRLRVEADGACWVSDLSTAGSENSLGNLLEDAFEEAWTSHAERATRAESAPRPVPGIADGCLAPAPSSDARTEQAVTAALRAERDDLRLARNIVQEEHRADIEQHKQLLAQLEGEVLDCQAELNARGTRLAELAAAALAIQEREASAGSELELCRQEMAVRQQRIEDLQALVADLEHVLRRVRGHRIYKWMKRIGLG